MVIRRRLDLVGPAMAFVTTGIDGGIPILSDPQIVKAVATQLKETVDRERLSLVGYVIMPNHVHLLIGFPRVERMSTILRDFKRLSAHRAREIMVAEDLARFVANGSFRFWQRRFDDVVITSEKQFRIKLNYIHQNPVRAGLVVREVDFPYSSAVDWMTGESSPVEVDTNWHWLERAGT